MTPTTAPSTRRPRTSPSLAGLLACVPFVAPGLAAAGWAASLALPLLGVGPAIAAEEAAPAVKTTPDMFDVLFDVGIIPSEKSAHVSIVLGKGSSAIEWIRMPFDPLRYRAIEANGKIEEVDGSIRWTPPSSGGRMRYVFSIDHLRDDKSYDSRCAKRWAVFRGEDLVPRVHIRTTPDARSVSTMRLRLPEGWSAALPYERIGAGRYSLKDRRTRFDRPSGWFAFGKIGVVRETLEGMRVAITGPAGQGVRRMDALALLKWTTPALKEVFGGLPERFQVVIAGDPMWRGGLSGPRSTFLHVERPLISEDSTSPLIHEVVHSLMHARADRDGDWIVEGFAEYYSIALLRRSGTLTAERYESSIEAIRSRAAPATTPLDSDMTSALRARAVVIMLEVDQLIRDATGGAANLDDLVRHLVATDLAFTPASFRESVRAVAGRDFPELFDRILPKSKASKPAAS